jgi:hypothetical protein
VLRLSLASLAFAACLGAPLSALAAEPSEGAPAPAAPSVSVPNVRGALAAGALAMLIPGVVGGTRTALGRSDGERTAGLLIASGGFALAPIVSHVAVREWGRAAVFGILPVGMSVAACAFISQEPGAVYNGNVASRSAFGILLGLGLIGAVVGLADTASADERALDRAKASRSAFFVAPSFGREGASLTFGGAL